MKKSLKITLIVLGSIVGLLLLISILLSPIAKGYVNKHGKDLVGRTIHVDHLGVNIWSGHVAIHDLTLYEDDDTTTFVSFDTLDVKAKLLRLIGHEVYLKHITLADLNVNVLQNGSEFNFNSLIDHFASDEPKEEDTTASDWKLCFYNIRLSHGHVQYSDLQRDKDWVIRDLNLKVPGFVIGGDENTDAGLNIALADGGNINIDAQYNSVSNDFNAEVQLDQFAVSNAKEYLTDFLNISNIQGFLGAHIAAQGNLSEIMKMDIHGDIALDDLAVTNTKESPVVSIGQLAIDIKSINLDNNTFDVNSITIDGLRGRFDRFADSTTNFSRLIKPQAPKSESAEDSKKDSAAALAPALNVHLAKFELKNSSFTYSDHTLPDPFEFPVSSINVTSEDFGLNGTNSAHIKANLPGGGSLVVDWSGMIDNWKQKQSLILLIKGLDMRLLSPYLVAYLGQPFTDGTFSLTSHNTITNSELRGLNHLDIYKATVGDRRKDVDAQLKLPLRAALYVLKDKDEKILLDVPISGNINSPEFNYMKLVWKTLGNLIVKVATSPARALGEALGLSGDDMEFLAVKPTQVDLTSEQYHQLTQLADVAKYDPNVHLILDQQVDSSSSEELLQLANKRDELVRNYFIQQSVKAEQVTVRTTLVAAPPKSGYAITSELLNQEKL